MSNNRHKYSKQPVFAVSHHFDCWACWWFCFFLPSDANEQLNDNVKFVIARSAHCSSIFSSGFQKIWLCVRWHVCEKIVLIDANSCLHPTKTSNFPWTMLWHFKKFSLLCTYGMLLRQKKTVYKVAVIYIKADKINHRMSTREALVTRFWVLVYQLRRAFVYFNRILLFLYTIAMFRKQQKKAKEKSKCLRDEERENILSVHSHEKDLWVWRACRKFLLNTSDGVGVCSISREFAQWKVQNWLESHANWAASA